MKYLLICLFLLRINLFLFTSEPYSLNVQPKVTILEFGANNCYYCQKMKKILLKIQVEFGDSVKVEFIDFNNFRNHRKINRYSIKEIPSQVFLDKQEKVISRHTGFLKENKIREIIKDELHND